MKKSQVLFKSITAITASLFASVAFAQAGAGPGAQPAVQTTTVPSADAPATNQTDLPGTSAPASGAIRKAPPKKSKSGLGSAKTVQPGYKSQSDPLPTTKSNNRAQEPSARPCPPSVSSGGADRPRVAGHLGLESTNCTPVTEETPSSLSK